MKDTDAERGMILYREIERLALAESDPDVRMSGITMALHEIAEGSGFGLANLTCANIMTRAEREGRPWFDHLGEVCAMLTIEMARAGNVEALAILRAGAMVFALGPDAVRAIERNPGYVALGTVRQ